MMTKDKTIEHELPVAYVTNYLFNKGFNWELFEGLSDLGVRKTEHIVAQWRFAEVFNVHEVKYIFKTFNLSFDEFIDEYAKSLKKV